MKTWADLEAIRQKTLSSIKLRREDEGQAVRVVVGMGTCGIAAGARDVLLAFVEETHKRGLSNVTVSQSGCMGQCELEPMVEVYLPGQDKVTYAHVKPETVGRIVDEHIVKGSPVQEYIVPNA